MPHLPNYNRHDSSHFEPRFTGRSVWIALAALFGFQLLMISMIFIRFAEEDRAMDQRASEPCLTEHRFGAAIFHREVPCHLAPINQLQKV